MQQEGSVFGERSASLEVRYTDKPVSGWGGLVAVIKYMERWGVRELLRPRRSPPPYNPPNLLPQPRPQLPVACTFPYPTALVTLLHGGFLF
jgi:hypothetical protein